MIEVTPTLAGGGYIEGTIGQAGFFRRRHAVVDLQAGVVGTLASNGELAGIDVDSLDLGSLLGKLLCQESDASAKVQ